MKLNLILVLVLVFLCGCRKEEWASSVEAARRAAPVETNPYAAYHNTNLPPGWEVVRNWKDCEQ